MPLPPPEPPNTDKVQINIDGVWKNVIVYINIGGVWKVATPYIKAAGVWKN